MCNTALCLSRKVHVYMVLHHWFLQVRHWNPSPNAPPELATEESFPRGIDPFVVVVVVVVVGVP